MKSDIINRWVILGALFIASALLVISLLIGFGFTVPQTESPDLQIAEITTIPGPTSTPRIAAEPTHDPAMGTATPLPGEIALYGYVQIGNTEGEGLRLRDAPTLNGEALFLGFDAEVFQIVDGPQQADGYTWWYLIAPYDETRTGWAAEAFLEAIPSPE